jgi:hypothetical protein
MEIVQTEKYAAVKANGVYAETVVQKKYIEKHAYQLWVRYSQKDYWLWVDKSMYDSAACNKRIVLKHYAGNDVLIDEKINKNKIPEGVFFIICSGALLVFTFKKKN